MAGSSGFICFSSIPCPRSFRKRFHKKFDLDSPRSWIVWHKVIIGGNQHTAFNFHPQKRVVTQAVDSPSISQGFAVPRLTSIVLATMRFI